MKSFLQTAIMGAWTAYALPDLTPREEAEVAGGIFWGVLEKENLTEMETCFTDGSYFVRNVIEAFELMADQKHEDFIEGTLLLAKTMENLPTYLNACESMQEDIKTFETWASIFLHPATLKSTVEGNITSHKAALLRDLAKARTDLKNDEYFQFGDVLGKMLVILTTPEPVEFVEGTAEDVVATVAGLIYGITQAAQYEEMLTCMTDADRFVGDIKTAVHEIITFNGDLRNFIVGYRMIADVVKTMPEMLAACENMGPELKEMESFFDEFLHPVNLVKRIAYNATHNIEAVTHDVLVIRHDLKHDEYFKFGEELGETLVLLTTPVPTTEFVQ